jgi:hypothetical protein
MTLLFIWMVAVRYDIEVLRDKVGDEELEVSLAERRAEGEEPEPELVTASAAPPVASVPGPPGGSGP